MRSETYSLLTCLSDAVCEIEVRAELPPFSIPPRADELKPVRLEEMAEVGVGQRARVAGVPGLREGVDGERLERIVGPELVDHEHVAAGSRHARELREHELGASDVVERPQRPGEVERRILERQLGAVA